MRAQRRSTRFPKLQAWMKANAINRTRIAAYIGKDKATITRIFQGSQDFNLQDIYRLALWSGLPLEDMASGESQTLIKVYGERLRSGAEIAK